MDWSYQVQQEDGTVRDLVQCIPSGWCLMVLFRHAECMECNLLVHELNELQNHLEEWDVTILGIGNSSVDALFRLRKRLGISSDIGLYTHGERKLHADLKLYNSFWRAWGPRAIWNTIKGFQRGHVQQSLGFPMGQQSGVVLLNPDKESVWIHRSQFLGDIPTQGEILEQVLIHRGV